MMHGNMNVKLDIFLLDATLLMV